MALRPISEAEFLRLSEGIPDYAGSDLEEIQARMRRASDAIDSGMKMVAEADLEAELRRLAAQ